MAVPKTLGKSISIKFGLCVAFHQQSWPDRIRETERARPLTRLASGKCSCRKNNRLTSHGIAIF